MGRPSTYPKELRDRAVRTVAELTPDYDSEHAAIRSVATKLGSGSAETVRKWVRQAQRKQGPRKGNLVGRGEDWLALEADSVACWGFSAWWRRR